MAEASVRMEILKKKTLPGSFDKELVETETTTSLLKLAFHFLFVKTERNVQTGREQTVSSTSDYQMVTTKFY